MKKILLLLPILALALVGCNTNDTENKLNGKLPSINKVTSESTTLVEECEVGYTIDFVNRTIQLTFNDFKTPGTSKVSLQTPELPFTITENGYSVSSTGAINPIVDGVQSPYYTMNNFNCNINVYSDGTYAADDYAFSFDIATPDGVTYGVRTDMQNWIFLGNSQTTFNSDGEGVYNYTDGLYGIQFDIENMKASFMMTNIKFVDKMPAFENMIFEKLDVENTPNGFRITGDKFTPKIGSDPYPKYEITDFVCNLNTYARTASVSFKCMGFEVSAIINVKPTTAEK